MPTDNQLTWTPEAQSRLKRVPEGIMRDLTQLRVEKLARHRGQTTVTEDMVEAKYRQWAEGSAQAVEEMSWTDEARQGIERVPAFVRGIAVQAVEAYARQRHLSEITPMILEEAKGFWGETGQFHRP